MRREVARECGLVPGERRDEREILEVEPRGDVTTDQRPRAGAARRLPLTGTHYETGFLTILGQAEHASLEHARPWLVTQQLQRCAAGEVPDFIRSHDVPA